MSGEGRWVSLQKRFQRSEIIQKSSKATNLWMSHILDISLKKKTKKLKNTQDDMNCVSQGMWHLFKGTKKSQWDLGTPHEDTNTLRLKLWDIPVIYLNYQSQPGS